MNYKQIIMNHEKISVRGFSGFAPSTEASSRTQEKTSGAKDIGPRILNIFSEIKSLRRSYTAIHSHTQPYLKFPPKIGGFYKFRSSIKKMTLL